MQEEKHCFRVWEQGPLWREAVEELHLIRVALEKLVAIKVGEGLTLRIQSVPYTFNPPVVTVPPSTCDPLPEYPVITCGD